MKIFDTESPLFIFFGKVFDIILLNALWMFISIPVVTMGAATSALYTVTLKMARNEEGYIYKGFFKALKANFVQATILWLLILAAGAVIFFDLWFFSRTSHPAGKVFIVLLSVALFFFLSIVVYIFPLQAKFKNTIPYIIRNSFLIAVSHFPYTLLFVVSVLLLGLSVYVFPWAGSFVIALYAFGASFIYCKIFDRFAPKDAAKEPSDSSFNPMDVN